MELPTVGVTMGDPAGIGPEITLKAVADDEVRRSARTVVLGDADHLESLADRVAIDVALRRIGAVDDPTAGEAVDVLDFDNVDQVEYGELSAENGRASLEYVDRAIDLATEGAVDGLANAPIHKKAIELAGSKHAGHTGLMAERTGTDRYAALVSDGELYVSHHSLHVPLSETIERISTGSVFETIELTAELVPEIGLEDPAVGVLGVNPHAGDGGVIGTLDDEEIRPAVERARDAGIDAEGPLPPDSAFNRALDGEFDCLVAMYHDQGHIPVFVDGRVPGGGVAGTVFTLGLSFVRTTTIHGTAYDVAGQGVAAPHSLIASITNTAEAIRTRDRHG